MLADCNLTGFLITQTPISVVLLSDSVVVVRGRDDSSRCISARKHCIPPVLTPGIAALFTFYTVGYFRWLDLPRYHHCQQQASQLAGPLVFSSHDQAHLPG